MKVFTPLFLSQRTMYRQCKPSIHIPIIKKNGLSHYTQRPSRRDAMFKPQLNRYVPSVPPFGGKVAAVYAIVFIQNDLGKVFFFVTDKMNATGQLKLMIKMSTQQTSMNQNAAAIAPQFTRLAYFVTL